MVDARRFDVCLINFDPSVGSELQKTRPSVVISPDSMNLSRLKTIIVAPMTTKIRDHFPTRVHLEFDGKRGQVALDQLRVIDRSRIAKNLGILESRQTKEEILRVLKIMFS